MAAFFIDRPTSALDPELVSEVLGVIERLAAEGTTMLIVTHEMRFAMRISDRIVFMENGVIEASGPPSELLASGADTRIFRFLSHSGHN
ncbi:amino acid ABC transporter ATP-binding protein [Agrobacterium tumefaciens]|uniref:amino acid ABC transporter ATP-binding protein n=1 Tax=Agrobacterium tumefaciens TaxID=358 RepID=UPI001885FB5B